jgi:hypothetical protein
MRAVPTFDAWKSKPNHNENGARVMADSLNFAMLVCAGVGSMLFGVLAAYGILKVGFALMRRQPRTAPLKTQSEAAPVS